MKLIEWINGITKLNKTTMDEFQNNVKEAVDKASQMGGVLTGSVVGWNGEGTPEGYEEVTDVFSEFVKAKGHIQSFTDYNQMTEAGVYRINKITTNAPENISDWGGIVIVFVPFKGDTVVCSQLAIQGDGISVDMRTCWYGTWTPWRKLF